MISSAADTMKIKHVACAMLLSVSGELLLQKREGISKYGEEWSFFGGWVEPGETPRNALVREMSEELGQDVTDWLYADLWETVHAMAWYDIEYHRHVFALRIPAWATDLVDREGAGAYFFGIDEAAKLKFNTPVHEELRRVKEYLES